MSTTPLFDDLAVEAIIDGDEVTAGLRHLAAFADGVRAMGDVPTPRPSPALARLLAAGGDAAAPAAATARTIERRTTRRRLSLAKVAGLGVVAKIGIGATAAAAGVVSAGAAGVLPGDAGRVVRDAIEVVTPVEFTDHDDRRGTAPGEPALDAGDHGDRVSSDATGESDGVPGVDGPEISQDAPGASRRPTEPPGPASRPHGEPGRPANPAPPVDPGAPPSTVPTPPSTSPSPPTTGGPSDPGDQDSTASQDGAPASAGTDTPAP